MSQPMPHTGFWSTDSARVSNRIDYWREAICQAIFELDFQASSTLLDAHLQRYEVGTVKLSEVSISTAHEVVRSRTAASRGDSPLFNLNYIRRGRWTVEHYGRRVELQAGELILLDSRQPYRVTATSGTDHICAHLPIDWLRCWIPDPEEAIARPISLGTPWRAALASSLDDAAAIASNTPGATDLCAQQIAGALALALGPARSMNTSHTRLIMLRILRTIGAMFFNHDLDAAKVAAALSISPRYLHKILAGESTTYERELMRIRLQHARAMLADQRFAGLCVSEIGYRAGFKDPSHFSRRFKADFGMSPGESRELSRLQSTGTH